METISKGLLAGNRRALAKAISLVEDGGPEAASLVADLFPHTGGAHLIGVTGSPGVGKSTLVDALIKVLRQEGHKVGVLAIDPTSPFTGGAILGDRIRMQEHTLDKEVFIRSMANRGQSGGLALAVFDAVRMLEASGYDVVVIETVGVGQSELAIAELADTTILVLMPGSGDEVQAIKSGIMEIGDIFVVNKGDLPGANKTATEILTNLELSKHPRGWRPKVLISIAETGEGMNAVLAAVQEHWSYLSASGKLKEKRRRKLQSELSELVAAKARETLKANMEHCTQTQKIVTRVIGHKLDPHSAAERLMKELLDAR